jgi:hypothetical protein
MRTPPKAGFLMNAEFGERRVFMERGEKPL